MKPLYSILSIGMILSLSSCVQPGKKTDEGQIRGREYTSKEIGWTMTIPEGWNAIDLENTQESAQRGKKVIEKSINMEIDDSRVKNLISFQKNELSIFQSSSEPFKLEYEGEWEVNSNAMKVLLYNAYENRGRTDSSATTIEKIDGLDFHVYSFTLYSPKGDAIMTQIIYRRLINGLSLNVSINYINENEKDKNEMLKAFRASRFTQRS
ncbi:hypothetical protein D3C87_34510 [compost metagenome]